MQMQAGAINLCSCCRFCCCRCCCSALLGCPDEKKMFSLSLAHTPVRARTHSLRDPAFLLLHCSVALHSPQATWKMNWAQVIQRWCGDVGVKAGTGWGKVGRWRKMVGEGKKGHYDFSQRLWGHFIEGAMCLWWWITFELYCDLTHSWKLRLNLNSVCVCVWL